MQNSIFIHPTANISELAEIGCDTKVWINVQIREYAQIGVSCIIGKDVYIDKKVFIGDRCKIQNGVSIFDGVIIESDVFVGPNVSFSNDKYPRAFNHDWKLVKTLIKQGASLGANSTIICGVTVGEYAMVGAGSVVTHDVPPYTLVVGNPSRPIAQIDKDGRRVDGLE